MKRKAVTIFLLIFLLLIAIISCKKKKTNNTLYQDSISSSLVFYKSKDTLYSPGGSSPHGNFKLKFNDVAVSAFDNTGKLPNGLSFPNGSVIVKEVYAGNQLSLYVIMKKDSKSKFAAKGWLWAEYDGSGKTVYDVNKNGAACTSCHLGGQNRDLTLSFDLH